ncbi:MAG: aspartate-semialdehyde dehydrogenase [Gammaproteobacteria bacterium]|nr:aspartate-semialdehyde dehydrogenase [Gammaproteobacteria bacterium]
MSKTFDIAIVGATGAVGTALIEILEERNFPIGKLYPLASARSVDETVMFRKRPIMVREADKFDFGQVQLAFFAAGGKVAAELAPKAAAAGCVVIDKSSHFRQDPDVPLIVPEVNPEALKDFRKKNIVACPNCSTIPMAVALKPIYDAVGVERINVATYQSVSGAGKAGIEELARQTAELLNGRGASPKVFSRQIAFNVIPHIDNFEDNGYTKEEMKMVWETRKIFDDEEIQVNPTCVRVPVFYGHSAALHVETGKPIHREEARQLLKKAPGVELVDEAKAGGYATPVSEAAGGDAVYVSRVRQDISYPCGLDLWVVSDNLRKGAALNAVQIAELLVKEYL